MVVNRHASGTTNSHCALHLRACPHLDYSSLFLASLRLLPQIPPKASVSLPRIWYGSPQLTAWIRPLDPPYSLFNVLLCLEARRAITMEECTLRPSLRCGCDFRRIKPCRP